MSAFFADIFVKKIKTFKVYMTGEFNIFLSLTEKTAVTDFGNSRSPGKKRFPGKVKYTHVKHMVLV
ncbi:unnamed protein product [marine sediment metagenome]|uniref:Uncharacterized protein n=1 Tax=marine sediment metagenome TaxID=412755 RepID=X1SSU8_9ZZZZ